MELCVLEWIILMQVIPDLQVLVCHLTMTVDTLNPMLRQDPTPRIVVGFPSMKVRTDQAGTIQGMNFIRMVDQGTRMGLGHTYQALGLFSSQVVSGSSISVIVQGS